MDGGGHHRIPAAGEEDLLRTSNGWGTIDVPLGKTLDDGTPIVYEARVFQASLVGLGAAIDYVQALGMERIARYEHDLLQYGTQALAPIPGLRLIGTAADKASVLSFVLKGWTTAEVGEALNAEGIAVRTGHHCAQPIHDHYGISATSRASFYVYNTNEEVDRFVAALYKTKEIFEF